MVLWRTFFQQFFTSETVSSDDQLRQTIVWVLAFLLVPGIIMLVQVFFDYAGIVARAVRFQQFDRLDDTLLWIEFVFVTYSMVTLGFVAVFVWDALTFDQRDAMVLGPLPLRARTIVTAKLAALGAFIGGAAMAVNVPDAFVFAFETGDQLGAVAVVRHFVAHVTATVMAAIFVFAGIVIVRGTVALVAGPRIAAALGSLLQFVFAVALLCFVILCPAVWRVPRPELTNTVTHSLPTAWFTGVFEWIRGSERWYVIPLATRAAIATIVAVAGGALTSIAGYRLHMQMALAPSATPSAGAGRLTRAIARRLVGRNSIALALSDFLLLTIARNRTHQTLIAMNAAVGVAIVLAAVVWVPDLASLTRPRMAVLWTPLVLAFWTTVGLRAAFFVPSELPASWTFRANAPETTTGYWAGVRATMLACVLPWSLAATAAVTIPLLGWTATAKHALLVCAVATIIVEAAALTIDFVPFTRPYQPGHANLKTRWWLYALGLWATAYMPVRLELRALGNPTAFAALLIGLAAAAAALELAGRARAARWAVRSIDEPPDPLSRLHVLDISSVAQRA